MAQVKPHLHYLTAKSASEVIRDFRKYFIIFVSIETLVTLGFLCAVIFARKSLELQIAVPGFFLFIMIWGISLLPHIFKTTKMLNEKGTIDIAPGLLTALQFVLNILLITGVIVPIFLWMKCDDLIKRHEAHLRRTTSS